ncbi:major facilitator superfamily domain-containing protein [Aspergillus novoparasiticus]|uniref:Major facilitator superfamily domain-containing protein n=1 Tax=Aspergillus novoparasiticus TaxID=986946 RepID=A0A5N6F2J2_9EURO|nr:major facilitator superfamily domain-containing protein [Aspergillus novoparasiticus]
MTAEPKEIPQGPAVEAGRDQKYVTLVDDEAEAKLNGLREAHGATWDSPDDPHNPYNWSLTRKVSIAIVVSCGQLATLMSTSMMAAALNQIAEDVGLSISVTQICFSIFLLGLAFGPFLVAALSEIYGRKFVWLISNVWYILWNSLCPVGNNPGLMMAGRFLAGCGASAGVTLTAPIMADLFHAKDRGKSLALATLIPYLGPALGPIMGGLASQHIHWHWLFWILSSFEALVTVLGAIILKESYTPTLLRRKARAQNPNLYPENSPLTQQFYIDLSTQLRKNIYRPLRLLLTRPIIQFLAIVYGLDFGIYVLMLSTYATLWIDRYHESETISSLNYLAIAIGTTIGAQAGGHLMDYIFRRMRDRPGAIVTPEFRIPYMIPSVLLIPIGLVWYGWSAENRISWVVVDIGAAIFTAGCFMVGQGMLAYLLDEFAHAASANAATRMLSNILGFAFPIFAPSLYDRLGFGWGNTLLALLYLGLGVPIPFVLWFWGPKIRAIGKEV